LKWYIPGLIAMVILSHFEAIQQSHFDFKGVFAGNLVRQFIFFVIILVLKLLHKPLSLQWLALYLSLSMIIGAVTIFLFSRKYLLYRFDPSWKWIRKITGYGGYIFGSGMISNIYSNLDQLMMATYSTISSVAYYNSASRITNFAEVPSFAAGEVIFPKVAKASLEEGTGKVKYLYEKMVAILLSFTIPLGIFVLLFPKFVILVIAGHNYLSAAPILRLYIIISMISPMQNQAANVLNSIGKPGLCFRLNFINLLGKGIITLICIRSIGFYGAAIGTLIASGLGYVVWYFVMARQIGSGLPGIIRNMAELRKTALLETRKLLLKFRDRDDQADRAERP
jgi:lipopolysaccharide exporter